MKIRYLSTSRLPTIKAYGVTVLETAEAAVRMEEDFLVYSPTSNQKKLKQYQRSLPSLQIPNFLDNRDLKLLKRFVFTINSCFISFSALCNSDFRSADVIWLRDPISAFIICRTRLNKQTLLELHHLPGKFGLKLLKILLRFRNLSICAISEELASQIRIETNSNEVLVCPMAVSPKFFCAINRSFSDGPIRFIYSGKGQSSGFDNGLEALVMNLQPVWKKYPNIQVTFLGLEDYYISLLKRQIKNMGFSKEVFVFLSHVSHDEVPGLLEQHDIGLLPYPENKYHAERFPIKSLEYAASGLAILASETRSHIQVIGEGYAWFYDPTASESMSLQVESMLSDPESRKHKLKQAQKWASNYTYESRISVVQDFFSNFVRE
jgi:glycosyltransferase involved in cell wall biosynthesis